MKRKNYTIEFKEGAIDLLRTSGRPIAQIARELGVSVASLRTWKSQFLGASGGLAGGAVGDGGQPVASAKELWEENKRLRLEVAHLQRQREILKKAASILAESPRLGM